MNPVEELFNSVLYCSLFGDERDGIVARWNMLQVPYYLLILYQCTNFFNTVRYQYSTVFRS